LGAFRGCGGHKKHLKPLGGEQSQMRNEHLKKR
jgi:hypothetical protein